MKFKEFLTESKKIGVMSKFIDTESTQSYLSPGPMNVKGNVEYSVYRKDGDISVPTDAQIKDAKSRTKDDFKNMVWFTPGGYGFMIMWKPMEDTAYIGARPNNATGKSLVFEEVEIDEPKDFENLVKKYSTEKAIRKYLKKQDGKEAEFL